MILERLEPRVLLSDTPFGTVLASDTNPSTVTDTDGTSIQVVLTGAGHWQLTQGNPGQGPNLSVTGTNGTSTLTLLTSTDGDGRFTVGKIDVQGAIKAITGAKTDLGGDLNVTGALGSSVLGNVTAASNVSIGGTSAIAKMVFGTVRDMKLSASAAIGTLSVQNWVASNGVDNTITANSIGLLQSAGDFGASLSLSGAGTVGRVLTSASIDGALGATGIWSIRGGVGQISARTVAQGWRGNVAGAMSQFVTSGDFNGRLASAVLNSLAVGGNLVNASVAIGADLGSDAQVGGTGGAADTFGQGILANLRVTGSVTNSAIRVGVDPVDGTYENGNDTFFSVGSTIQQFLVGGTIDSNSTIEATNLPTTVRINGQTVDPTTDAHFRTTPLHIVGVQLTGALAVDTGANTSDGLTSNPSITGSAITLGTIASLKVGLDGAAVGTYTSLLGSLDADGSFHLDQTAMNALAGGTLADGAHTLHIIATDQTAITTTLDVSFTLDTVAPAAPTFDLATASDTETIGDQMTSLATVTITGSAPTGTSLRLVTPNLSTTADAQGKFSFANLTLGVGDNPFTVVATDGAGNSSTYSLTIKRVINGSDLTAALQADTGASATDGVTKNPAVTGTLAPRNGATITSFKAGFDSAAANTYVDVSGSLSSGVFTLTKATLDTVAGGTLADGAHVLHLVVLDSKGFTTTQDVAFTLDTAAPTTPVFDLAASDKVGSTGHQTNSAAAGFTGTTSPGATVTLGSATTVANTSGVFQFSSVALAVGDNVLTVTATDLAGNSSNSQLTVTRNNVTVTADTAVQWVRITLQAIANDGSQPEFASRTLAMQGIAAYDAVNAINGSPGYLVSMAAPAGASADAAIAAASYTLLSNIYPAQKASLDALYLQSLNAIPDGQAKTDGIALGTAIGNRVFQIRLTDGFDKFATFDGGTDVGEWRPTAPLYDVPSNPQWATLTPFAMTSPDQFRPAGITVPLTSQEYADAINQVKSLGALTGSTRTADQTQIARFWAEGIGTYTPPGGWAEIATEVAVAKGQSLTQNVKLFAELGVAVADAAIAAWDAKYTYGTWRPETAIQNADEIGNPGIVQDPDWQPFIITPNHPDYVSGHSTFSGAAATVLAATFGDNVTFTTGSTSLPGVTRTFTSFSQAEAEAGISRIYGGIHTTFANEDGKALGQKVGAWALKTFDLSQDVQPPKLVLNQTSGLTTNQALTVTGTITDQLSGVASLTVSIDGAAATAVTFNTQTGAFSVPTNLPLNGSADGAHQLFFDATDAAGNKMPSVTLNLTLITQAPTVTFSAGSIVDGAELDPTGSYLIGQATPSFGKLAGLNYRIDGGTVMPMQYDSAGRFATTIDLSKIGIGSHVITMSATDLAGNVTTKTLNLTLPALVPLTVTNITPTDGAIDVGVTYRPKVTFSRAVNAATLNSDSYYATDGAGNIIASKVVITDDHKSAFLFFTNPMPGSTKVTLHVDGSKIRGEADGTFLDAANTGATGTDLTSTFTTVSTTTVANTTLIGTILDPGPDLQPMTFDDVRGGPDGRVHTSDDVYLHPIAGVKVYILGHEDQFVFTDAQGKFTLTNVPVGDVKVEVDGTTATNAPTGFYFPSMVMDATIRAGITNTLMGSMGSADVQDANDGYPVAYLPRVQTNILQSVSDTQVTTITAMQGASAATRIPITDAQRQQIQLTVQPGSILDADGNPLENAQVGISTVPATLVKDMLPPGLLQHTFDITIQAPGASVFTTPATLTMPNIFGLAPGEKTYILSFDHTTGKLVIDGTATVSADGLTVTSDPGQGVTSPGWHGVTPPGSTPDTPPPPCPPLPAVPTPDPNPPTPTEHVVPMMTGDTPAPTSLNSFSVQAPPSGYVRTVVVTVSPELSKVLEQSSQSLLGQVGNFLTGTTLVPLSGGAWTMTSDNGPITFDWTGISNDKLKAAGLLDVFSVYGGDVTISVTTQKMDDNHTPDGQCPPDPNQDPPVKTIDKFFLYRYLDPVNASQSILASKGDAAALAADVLPFPDAVAAGTTAVSIQKQTLELHIGGDANVAPSIKSGGDAYTIGGSTITFFAPKAQAYNGAVEFKPGASIKLYGVGKEPQKFYVNTAGLAAMLQKISENTAAAPTLPAGTVDFSGVLLAAEKTAFDATHAAATAQAIYDQAVAYYTAAVGGNVILSSGTGADGSQVNYGTTEAGAAVGDASWTVGTVGSPYGSGIDNNTDLTALVAKAAQLPKAAIQYDLPQAINQKRAGSMTVFAVSELFTSSSLAGFISDIAETIAHEIGHTFGLVHIQGNTGAGYNITGGNDVMSYDPNPAGTAVPSGWVFNKSKDALQLALDQFVTATNVTNALNYYKKSKNTPAGHGGFKEAPANGQAVPTDSNDPEDAFTPVAGKALVVTDGNDDIVTGVDFGSVLLSSGIQSKTFTLTNYGDTTLNLTGATISGSKALGISLPNDFLGALATGEQVQLTVTYLPTLGPSTGLLSIASDAGPITIGVNGSGTVATAGAAVDISHNNLGGALIGNTITTDAITITNYGSTPLTISGVSVTDGASQFKVNGLPADIASNPITIAAGASYNVSVTYTASQAGLERGTIKFTTNDPARPTLSVGVVATGALPNTVGRWGNNDVAISFPSIGDVATVRLQSDAMGNFDGFLPPDTYYEISVYDRTTGLIAKGSGVTSPAGQSTALTKTLTFRVSTAQDSDSDGLPDDIEYTLGTSLTAKDTNSDGIDDFTAIKQGLDALTGFGLTTGVVSSAKLNGPANSIAVVAAVNNPSNLTAYIAEGTAGLAVVDVSNLQKPSIVAQLVVPGDNTDVAVDSSRNVAVLASSAGLNLVDITNPAAPALVQTVQFADQVSRIALRDGIAYVATGTNIATVNILTGDILQTIDLSSGGGTRLTDLTFDGDTLLTLDTNRRLSAFTLTGETIAARGKVNLPTSGNADGAFPQTYGDGRITAGGGLVYVEAGNGGVGGYQTVNVTNPDSLTLVSDVDRFGVAGTAMALNGSGLGIAVGSSNFVVGAFQGLDILDVSDPTKTGQFVTRTNLPDVPNDVFVANGIAFVADGASGLQIVNYLAFDTKGVAPTVTANIQALDRDPNKAGIQVIEGDLIHIFPTITDDVQVRNVELLVNGQVVENDASYPFSFSTLAPSISSGGTSMNIQIEAIDTGGNQTITAPITLEVVKDTFPPTLVKSSVAENAHLFFVKSVDFTFDSTLDLTKLDPAGVKLVNIGLDGTVGTADDTNVAFTLDTRANGQIVSVRPTSYLLPGTYKLTIAAADIVDHSGNVATSPITLDFTIRPASNIQALSGAPAITQAPSANAGQTISIPVPFDPSTAFATFHILNDGGTASTRDVQVTGYDAGTGIARFVVPFDAVTGDVTIFSQVGNTKTNFDDGTFLLQVVPIVTGITNVSLNGDGTATVTLAGYGFIESNNSTYQFGTTIITDSSTNQGPDVYSGYINNNYYNNSQVNVRVPITDESFGAISVTTAGGTSTLLTTGLTGVTSTALSGTPADATKASANPGQSVTLNGTGLTTSTDVILTYIDSNGNQQQQILNPSSAKADGTSATLSIPLQANGVFALRVFGSSASPLLQIVPLLVAESGNGNSMNVTGRGFVEGATTINLAGASVVDTVTNAGPDISATYVNGTYSDNSIIYLTEPQHGAGTLTVTTAGGTSAPITVSTTDPNLTGLGDIGADTTANTVWVISDGSPAVLNQVDASTGQIVKTIALPSGTYGSTYGYYSGLQVAPAALTLGSTAVAKGSLLLFNGQVNPDNVLAINPSTGALIGTLSLAGNYDLTGGTYDPATDHLFVVARNSPGLRMVELNAQTGAEINSFSLPFGAGQSAVAVDPTTGNLWYGSDNTRTIALINKSTGAVLRYIDLSLQGLSDVITGMAFDASGKLLVSEPNGGIFKADLTYDPANTKPTLTSITAAASDGTALQNNVASANVGQTITLTGTNFGAGTEVLFQTRDNAGNLGTVAVTPSAISADGKTLQVVVPGLAATGNIQVVNIASQNLGFNSHNDSIYRKVTLNFTATGSTSTIRFADDGLQDINDESWGIDNVTVKQGATTVFQDNFEGGANAAWSDPTVNTDAQGVFSQFSGRFGNSEQKLSLTGLTAGQSYTLTFDLYVLDSWDGAGGPDLFEVSADGTLLMRDAFANYSTTQVQTFNASAGVRLQVVPTLTGVSNGRPGNPSTSTSSSYDLLGSGFQAGVSTITLGGIAIPEPYTNQNNSYVSGGSNNDYHLTTGITLDGTIRITTDGGYAQISGPAFGVQPAVSFTGITASAAAGIPADATKPSANSGQQITLTGQGFTNQTLVQFTATDDSGTTGTVTRTGSASGDGKTLTITVPALAKTGTVTVLGSNQSYTLQVVPQLRAIGGTIAAGNVIELDGTGLNPAELQIQIDGIGVGAFTVKTVADNAYYYTYRTQQILSLTVPNGVSAGLITVSTKGGSAGIKTGIASTVLSAVNPANDVGDTIATATALTLPSNSKVTINSTAGNGTQSGLDVDMYAATFTAGDQLTFSFGNSSEYSHLRIFTAAGTQLRDEYVGSNSVVQFTVPTAGTYYIGVSGYYNNDYDPTVANSGSSSGYQGAYQLTVDRRDAGTTSLSGITATAAQGTPAKSAVASANAGQTITLTGNFVAGDQIVFSTNDNSYYSETTVTPATIAGDGKSLTVVVPTDATTGTVRLAREQSGIVLQIVPTLSDITLSNGGTYINGSLTLTGTGFAPGAQTVQLGAAALSGAQNYYYYNSNTQTYVTVPNGAPTGPISMTTLGGTSNVIQRTFTGIQALASTGTAADGSKASANPGQTITIQGSNLTNATSIVFQTIDSNGTKSEVVTTPTIVAADGNSAQIVVPLNAITGFVRVVGDTANASIKLQIVPVVTGISNVSLNGDGTATVQLAGAGFIEGNDSAYRFGTTVVNDPGPNSGPDSFGGYYNGNYSNNNVANVVVKLINGSFGSIGVTTAGGTSAAFSVSLASITSTALTGTAADTSKASANPGQTITLNGSGLTTGTDVILTYVDSGGTQQRVVLNPNSAKADGTSATLIVPPYANGAFALRVFGSSATPLLQIVPVVVAESGNGSTAGITGYGFVEGATTISFPGGSVTDTVTNSGPDIYATYVYGNYSDNSFISLTEPQHGAGTLTVTTAGGTSAPITTPTTDPDAGGLGDIGADTSANTVWVISSGSPATLSQISASTGQVIKTIALTQGTYGSTYGYYSGLQVAPTALTLGSTAVSAGSLLLFNGQVNPDNVLAINPSTGALIATLNLAGNYDLTGGAYDPATDHMFVVARNSPGLRMVELDAQTGAEINSFSLPFGAGQSAVAIDPATGNLWYGSDATRTIALINKSTGAVIRYVDLSLQGLADTITGMAFDANGKLLVSEPNGGIFKADLTYDPATAKPTLTAITSTASNGTALQNGVASANVGQTITLTGTNFGAGTEILFQTRDNAGNLGITAVTPSAISADGTTMQVVVPGLAATGNIQVVNIGSQNLGFSSYNDAIYRKVTLNFTATGSTSTIRFADDGIQDVSDESWGIDNVAVKQGATTIFSDTFEGGANGAWSNPTVNTDAQGVFSQFSGRFSNAEQKLSLTGLTAGQSYTLTFDLYMLDSWDGATGPDMFEVSADGTLLMRDTFANYSTTQPQSFNASAGVRLQVVPTLTGLANSRPGTGTSSSYDLIGSGFQAGASTFTIGGITIPQSVLSQNEVYVSGGSNNDYRLTTGVTLEGAIRVTTDGGYAEIAGPNFGAQPLVSFTGIQTTAAVGVAADTSKPSANAGQQIVLTGQGFTNQTLVQFVGIDDAGTSGTLTRTGSASNDGKTLTITVPVLAKTGAVTVLGSNQSITLQIVPLLRAVGGAISAGNVIEIDGTGLNPNGLQVFIDGIAATNLSVKTVADNGNASSSYVSQQILTLTVPAGVSAGRITVTSAGGSAALQTGVASTTLAAVNPASDVGDTIATATALTLPANSRFTLNSTTANGTQSGLDVDMYAVTLAAGDQINITTSSNSQYSHLRIFSAAGAQLLDRYMGQSDVAQFTAPAAGTYYLGVSGYYNNNYNPTTANSGTSSSYVGSYQWTIDRREVGSSSLSGITATATSGTAAKSGIPSANTGQTITINGTGLTSADRIIFTFDSSGSLITQQVNPATVASDGTSLTVVVPGGAATGMVRLAREQSGILLQIVPTVSDLSFSVNNSYVGQQITVSGTGFSAVNESVSFGGTPAKPYSYSGNTQLYVTVPNAAATGPITVTTIGGTSSAFQRTFTGLTGTAGSGTAADSNKASANPGQTITIAGTNLTSNTGIVFRTVDSNGTPREYIVNPATVSQDKTSATVIVPLNATTGIVRVIGDTTNTNIMLQIVPTIASFYEDGSSLVASGRGFVEGASTYAVASATVTDANPSSSGVDVYGGYVANVYADNSTAVMVDPTHGFGSFSVTTAGGTSAPIALETVDPNLGNLGDIAIDTTSGAMFVNNFNSPTAIYQVNPTTGATIKTIALPTGTFGNSYGYYSGMQVAPAAFTLGSTAVAKGSLLLFNGYAFNDTVLAINPTTGALIASLSLAGNYDATGGAYDPVTGHIFVVGANGGKIYEVNATTGAEISNFSPPNGIGATGLAIDPTTGNLWFGTDQTKTISLLDKTGTVTKTVDLTTSLQNVGISGLAFDANGKLLISTTQGVIIRVTLP